MASRFESLLDGVSLSLDTHSTARQVVELPLDRIESDPNNPRRTFSNDELGEMAASITAHGVLQPIVVRQVGDEQRYVIRFGDRRYRASKLAGLATIPAIIAESGEETDDLVQQVVENDQRVDLTAGELAAAVAKLTTAGMKQADIAKRLGRPKPMISMYAAVASMPPIVGDLAASLAIRTVYELHQAWKADKARTEEFITLRGSDPITTAEARALAKAASEPPEPEPVPIATSPSESLSEQTRVPAGPGDDNDDVQGGGTTAARKPRLKAGRGVSPFVVEVDGRRGRLVLSGMVQVLFDDASRPEPIDAGDVKPLTA